MTVYQNYEPIIIAFGKIYTLYITTVRTNLYCHHIDEIKRLFKEPKDVNIRKSDYQAEKKDYNGVRTNTQLMLYVLSFVADRCVLL